MTASFYVPLGEDRWRGTVHTAGPWDERAQHGGPPSALLGRAIQRCAPRDDMIVARFTAEILGAIPVGDIEVRARVARPGRSVELLEAVASAGSRDVACARAWRVLRTASPSVDSRGVRPPAMPGEAVTGPPGGWVDGYLSAVEWRPVRGSFGSPGPATVWARLRYPLVPDEETGPLERVLAVADSGSGISSVTSPAGNSSTQSSPCICTGPPWASGSAWTPGRPYRPAAPAWPRRSCTTSTARSASVPSHCW